MSIRALTIAMMANVPVLVEGGPGLGKTATFYDLADSLDWHLEPVIASIREPSDFSGLPVIGDDNSVHFAPPVWAKRLVDSKKRRKVLFLDEITTTPPATQAALLRVVLDRWVGDLELPKDVAIVSACNPPEQAANGWTLAPPLANRFCHFQYSDTLDSWSEGMVSGWPKTARQELPENWDEPIKIQLARTTIVSFIRHRPNLRNAFPKDEASAGKAWPSNRSWDMAARLLTAARSMGHKDTDDTVFELIAGCVGEGPAVEFKNWAEGDELPDLEEVLKDPKKLVVPKRGDRAFAVLSGIAAIVVSNNTEPRWHNGWKIMAAAADMGAADVAVTCARILVKNRPKPNMLPPKEAMRFKDVLVGAKIW